ncbi:MAG TPA: hypothetical protein VFT53_05400 [Candidatus Saccharimonadales bacterium]|nr:hypothetical protein [Candidatus Saccharimonadales bacterium]
MHIIEFVGMPRAGKTTQLNLLKSCLRNHGHTVEVIDDRVRASQVAAPFTNSLAYVMSFATTALNERHRHKDIDFLLIDRGFNDVRVWADFYAQIGNITAREKDGLTYIFDRFAQQVTLTLNFQVPVEKSIKRHLRIGNTITADDLIMNEGNLRILKHAYERNGTFLHEEVTIDGCKSVYAIQATVCKAIMEKGISSTVGRSGR